MIAQPWILLIVGGELRSVARNEFSSRLLLREKRALSKELDRVVVIVIIVVPEYGMLLKKKKKNARVDRLNRSKPREITASG